MDHYSRAVSGCSYRCSRSDFSVLLPQQVEETVYRKVNPPIYLDAMVFERKNLSRTAVNIHTIMRWTMGRCFLGQCLFKKIFKFTSIETGLLKSMSEVLMLICVSLVIILLYVFPIVAKRQAFF